MKITKNLTEGNIYKNYFLYALPLIFSSLLSSLYSTVDAVVAGKFISEHALGAISVTSSFDMLFFAFFDGFSGGFSIYIAQLFGKGKNSTIKKDSINMALFVTIFSIVISIVSIMCRNPILDYLNVDPTLRDDARTYFTIYTAGYFLTYVNMILVKVLHALGVTSFSVYVSIISSVIHILGNLFAVLVLGMGVEGLAYSTLLSVLGSTIIYIIVVIKAFGELECEKKKHRFDLLCVKKSLCYTLPASVQKLAFYAAGFFVSPTINALGADATTGYAVMTRMYNVCAQSFWNTSAGVDCYTGQCVGMGNHKKLRGGLWAGLWMNVIMLTPFALIFFFFVKPIASIFFPAGYVGTAYEYVIRFFRVYTPFLYINMIGHLMHSYMRSIGRVNTVLWVTIVGSIVRIASTIMLVPVFSMDGAYIGQVLSWIADGGLCVIIYFALYHSEQQIKRIVDKIRAKS